MSRSRFRVAGAYDPGDGDRWIIAFLFMFPSTGQVPIDQDGWLATVAQINPITPVLAMTRQGFLGEVTWSQTWPGALVVVVGLVVFGAFALTQLRRLER